MELAFEPTSGTLKDPVPVLEQRIVLLEGEVRMLHQKLLAARRQLALLQGTDPQLAIDQILAELKKAEAERLPREQELVAAKETEAPPQESSAKPARRGHGPTAQPHLPEIEEIHELAGSACECKVCGGTLEKMPGQFEESEEITVIERQYARKLIRRQKYRCSCNGNIQTAPQPPRLVPGGRYSLEFATHVAINKHLDHLPLERQVRMMARQGLEVTSQTLWDQSWALALVVRPTYDALGRLILEEVVLHADETRWPLLDGSGDCAWTAWTRTSPGIAHYTILSSKSAEAAHRLFSGYRGIVVCDGYAVYPKLARAGPQMQLANCWAHVQRKFREAEENHPLQCRKILDLIGRLYAVESRVSGPFPGDETAQQLRHRLRQEESKQILAEIRQWAETEVGLPRSDLGRAVRYMLKRWDALTVFVDNPLVPLDNNAAERSLRGPVVGRKNHYGSKSKRGTEAAAIFYTLLETAKLQGVEPAFYLKTVAERALTTPGTVTLPKDLL